MISAVAALVAALLVVASGNTEVVITAPEPGVALFGTTTVAAEVYPADPKGDLRVELMVDGMSAGILTKPPFEWQVELGDDNKAHLFQVVATSSSQALDGESVGVARLESPAVRVDDTLDLELRQLYVTVERDSRRELGLTANDFQVIDNRHRQELVTFERGDVPMTAFLLVDASISMSGDRLRHAIAGATTFASSMRDLDLAKLFLFSDRVIAATPFTSFGEVLATTLDRVETTGDTALFDHLYLALRALDERQGRRVIIVLSDGIDVVSVLTSAQLVEAAKRSQSIIYWLRTNPETASQSVRSSWKGVDQHRRDLEDLESICRGSGGRVIEVAKIQDATHAFSELLAELRDQYVLGYYPNTERRTGSAAEDRWHRVRVRVADRSLTVTTREGYFDF